jgi:hypothetical protein
MLVSNFQLSSKSIQYHSADLPVFQGQIFDKEYSAVLENGQYYAKRTLYLPSAVHKL